MSLQQFRRPTLRDKLERISNEKLQAEIDKLDLGAETKDTTKPKEKVVNRKSKKNE